MPSRSPNAPASLRAALAWGAAAAALATALYLVAWPLPFVPRSWTPPPAPAFEGPYRPDPTAALSTLSRLELPGRGPEDVAVGPDGSLYAGTAEGTVWRRAPGEGGAWTAFAATGGRPLGLAFAPDGRLIVADATRGLLAVSPAGQVTVLATEAGGRAFGLADDMAVARDGTIYFTDAADRPFPPDDNQAEILEHAPSGRVLKYDPATRRATVVADGLYFANGVALEAGEASLLVTELTSYRVLRVWLRGPRSGNREVALDNLPGFPDGLTADGHGGYWVALASPRVPLLDRLLPHPFLRAVVARLPRFMVYHPRRFAAAVHLDARARVDRTLLDADGRRFTTVTSAVAHQGKLYLGSLSESAIGVVTL